MSDRITREDIEKQLQRLNENSKLHYDLEGSYGKWQISVALPGQEHGSIYDNLTYLGTKSEVYNQLRAIERYKHLEENANGLIQQQKEIQKNRG